MRLSDSSRLLWMGANILALCSAAAAQPAGAVIDLSGQVDLPRLVDLSSQRLKLNVEYDAAALKAAGQVTLRLGTGLSDEQLWGLTNRVLISRGFATIRVPGKSAYAVVKLADVAGLTGLGGAAIEAGDPAPSYRTAVVQARHRSAKELSDVVSKIISKPGGSVVPLKESGEAGLLLISDVSSRLDQALALLERVDVPLTRNAVEEVPVHNFTAQQVAALVAQINAKREQVSGEKIAGEVLPASDGSSVFLVCDAANSEYWKGLIAQLDRREGTETVIYTPRTFPAKDVGKLLEQSIRPAVPDDRWRMAIDDLTGSLIITTTPTQHQQVRAQIERLDAIPGSTRRPVKSFVIRNRPVREIQSTLEQLAQSGVLGADPSPAALTAASNTSSTSTSVWPPTPPAAASTAPTTPGSAATPPSSAPKPPLSSTALGSSSAPRPDLSLSSDEGTNTLIVMGEPRLLAQVETLLQALDVRQPQVMLEVLILSLTESQTLDLGLELERISGGETRTRIASLFGLSTRDAAGNVNAGNGLGLTGVVLSPGDFSVVFRALQTLNKGRSLSMPRVLVTNNQQATLDSVLEQPYASTNASNTVTTTSFGGSKPAGTQITLKPQIQGSAGNLLLDYSVSLSAFVGAAANSSVPPPRQENKLQSVASLPDGHTVVVGGIELIADGKATSQVPGLGSIPIFGEAFKNRSNTASRSRFYVFIRANILGARGYEDLKFLSEIATTDAGVDDGWPVVEPRVMR